MRSRANEPVTMAMRSSRSAGTKPIAVTATAAMPLARNSRGSQRRSPQSSSMPASHAA
jgi:hypothetical protein